MFSNLVETYMVTNSSKAPGHLGAYLAWEFLCNDLSLFPLFPAMRFLAFGNHLICRLKSDCTLPVDV